jgi:hypothetical protein
MTSETEILQYLKENDYIDVYTFLITSIDNLRNRGTLLKNCIERFEEKIEAALRKVEMNPDVDPKDKEMSNCIKDIHYAELEAIQELNILIELLAVYYRLVRTDLRRLPKAIGKKDISSRELYEEFAYFKNQTLEDIRRNLVYPNLENFPELSSEEKGILKGFFEDSLKQIQGMFSRIFGFQERFRPIYNKYKHTLSEITGIYGINKEAKRLESQIYLRIKHDGDFQTYIVGAGSEAVKYLKEIGEMTYQVLRITIDSALLHLANVGKDFIPRTIFARDDNDMFQTIASNIRSCRVPNFESFVIVQKPSPEIMDKVNKEIQENYVYIMNKDIMSPSNMLKEGIRLTGKTDAYVKDNPDRRVS